MAARRYNKTKLRYELIPQHALEKLVEVYTKGAHKYTIYENKNGDKIKGTEVPFEKLSELDLKIVEDGANNWRLGQNWTSSMASVKRHICEWEKGIDIDPDPSMGTYHLANAAWGLFSILEYYKIYPQGDDRIANLTFVPDIGLDIDGVLGAFSEDYLSHFDLDPTPAKHWNDPRFRDEGRWKELEQNEKFWTNMTVLHKPEDLLFEPKCYVTARSIPQEWTEKWLFEVNDFPIAPVVSVGRGGSKVEALKEHGVDIFVDDAYHNFKTLNSAGIFTYLKTRSHNVKYDVGHRRIDSLNDIINYDARIKTALPETK